MKLVSPTSAQQREDTALSWLSRLASRPANQHLDVRVLPAAEQHQLEQWLADDPANAQAFAEARAFWLLTAAPAARIAKEDASALSTYLQQHARGKRRRRLNAAAAAIAATVVIAITLSITTRPERWLENALADYHTGPGQVQSLVLADGSEVTLDGDSAISVSLGAGYRDIRLTRGAAYFHVFHNGEPFVVRTGDGDVRVLGTQFEVRLGAENTQVTVEQGRVGVDALGHAQQQLTAGQRVGFGSQGLGAMETVNAQQALGWRAGRVSLRQQPLKDALEMLQRYYPQRIVLLNPEIAGRPVSGEFSAQDPQAILTAMQSLLSFSLKRLPGGTVVIW